MSDLCDINTTSNIQNIANLLQIFNYFIQYEKNARYREGSLTNKSGTDYPESIKTNSRFIEQKILEVRKKELIDIIKPRLTIKSQLSNEVKKELEEIIETKNLVSLDTILDGFSFFRADEDKRKIKNQAEKLISNDSFLLCDCILEKYDKNGTIKIPAIIFTCYLVDEHVFVKEYVVNYKALQIIMAGVLAEEIEILEQSYSKEMQELCNELNSCMNQKEMEQIIDFIDETITARYPAAEKSWKGFSEHEGWRRTRKIFITHEAIEGVLEPIFRKEIENICTLIKDKDNVPELLSKYILGSELSREFNPFDISINSNLVSHIGSYTAEYPVNFKQWNILQLEQDSKLLAVSGPPGTGKTTLLKEIMANEFVQKAVTIAEHWDVPWTEATYKGTNPYAIMPNLEKISRHSMVVASTNNAAVDNIGDELAQEISFCKAIVAAGLEPADQSSSYTGTFCGQMGNKKNFEEKFLAYFKNFQRGLSTMEVSEEKASEIQKTFIKTYREFQDVNETFIQVLACRKALYAGLKDVASVNELVEKDFPSMLSILQARLDQMDSHIEQVKAEKCKLETNHLINKQTLDEVGAKLSTLNHDVQTIEQNVAKLQAERKELYVDYETYKQRKKWGWFATLWPAWRVFFNQYPSLRYIDDCIEDKKTCIEKQQNEIQVATKGIAQHNIEKLRLEEVASNLSAQINALDCNLIELDKRRKNLQENIRSIELLMQDFTDALHRYLQIIEISKSGLADEMVKLVGCVEINERESEYWYNLANRPKLLTLRHTLFEQALVLMEQYILRNRKEILKNFDLILGKNAKSGWFNPFYNPLETYNTDQVACLNSLWNTIFLCFPIITCTLHSFKGEFSNFKQLVPNLIGLLLIDEAGQILPHYLCGPLFRSQRAIIVGDVAQIEPVRAKGSEIIDDEQFEYMSEAEKDRIRISANSAQTYANRGSDFWEEMRGRHEGVILEEHRRCERSIIEYSNRYVYSNKLKVFKEDNHKKFLDKNLLAIDVRGPKDEGRHANQTEIDFCANLLPDLQKEYGDSIAVITPFRAQATLLEKRLGIAAGTVHKFQGQEKDCIIFSLVVDSWDKQKGLVKFIGGAANMLNVALSRAKKQFIVVGNLTILENTRNQLGNLFKILEEKGRIISLFNMERYGQLEPAELEMLCRYMANKPSNLKDTIGQYIQAKFPLGIIGSATEHQNLFREVVANISGSLVIHSPWIIEEIGSSPVVADIERQCGQGKSVKVYYGYRKVAGSVPPEGIDDSQFFRTLLNTDYSGDAYRERARKAILKLHSILGKNLIYNAPTHVKLLIIDDRYAIVGSYNWLSGSLVSNRNEVSYVITNKETVRYLKEEMFG